MVHQREQWPRRAQQVAEQRHELQRLGVRDESQHLDGMMPAGIGPASAASLAAGGGQEQVQRGLASRSAWPDGIGKTSNLARPASHETAISVTHSSGSRYGIALTSLLDPVFDVESESGLRFEPNPRL